MSKWHELVQESINRENFMRMLADELREMPALAKAQLQPSYDDHPRAKHICEFRIRIEFWIDITVYVGTNEVEIRGHRRRNCSDWINWRLPLGDPNWLGYINELTRRDVIRRVDEIIKPNAD